MHAQAAETGPAAASADFGAPPPPRFGMPIVMPAAIFSPFFTKILKLGSQSRTISYDVCAKQKARKKNFLY